MSVHLRDFVSIRSNQFFLHEVSIAALATQYGTPLYVYSLDIFHHIADYYLSRLGPGVDIRFAIKSNSNIDLLRYAGSLGLGADVVSGGEMARALEAGIAADRIDYAGVGKTRAELDAALRANIGYICLESEHEIGQLSTLLPDLRESTTRFLVRINSNVDPDTHPYLTTGLDENKFGVSFDRVVQMLSIWQEQLHGRIVGIQVHIGSQIFDIEQIKVSAQIAVECMRARSDLGLTVLNLGGGLGVDYDQSAIPSIDAYCAMVKQIAIDFGGRTIIEPGRSLAALCGILVGTCLQFKEGETKNFIICDIGMNDLIRPALYKSHHKISFSYTGSREPSPKPVDIVGPICESGDFIGIKRNTPKLQPGDLVVVECAGAYGYVMASRYNLRQLPAEIIVHGSAHSLSTPSQ